ncbi:MAG: DUF951 domain-containing protein [Thermoflexales bacterium]|nr:DUF951 domain-containing protein [Thermoflexales bacterium]
MRGPPIEAKIIVSGGGYNPVVAYLEVTPVNVGQVVRLRKPHPCGSVTWEIRRLGADVGLKCQGCGRIVMLTRREFERRLDPKDKGGQTK